MILDPVIDDGSDVVGCYSVASLPSVYLYKPLTVYLLLPTDDHWRVPFSLSEAHQI